MTRRITSICLACMFSLLVSCYNATQAESISVRDPSELIAAMKRARPGDEVVLAEGHRPEAFSHGVTELRSRVTPVTRTPGEAT